MTTIKESENDYRYRVVRENPMLYIEDEIASFCYHYKMDYKAILKKVSESDAYKVFHNKLIELLEIEGQKTQTAYHTDKTLERLKS